MRSGVVIAATSETKSRMPWCVVGGAWVSAVMVSLSSRRVRAGRVVTGVAPDTVVGRRASSAREATEASVSHLLDRSTPCVRRHTGLDEPVGHGFSQVTHGDP